MGFTWHHYADKGLGAYNDVDTFTLGLQLRPFRYIAFGLTGDYIGEPVIGGKALQPVWTSGVGIRPGTEAMYASGFLRTGDDLEGIGYGARLETELFLGLTLFGRYDSNDLSEGRSHRFIFGLGTRSGSKYPAFMHFQTRVWMTPNQVGHSTPEQRRRVRNPFVGVEAP